MNSFAAEKYTLKNHDITLNNNTKNTIYAFLKQLWDSKICFILQYTILLLRCNNPNT